MARSGSMKCLIGRWPKNLSIGARGGGALLGACLGAALAGCGGDSLGGFFSNATPSELVDDAGSSSPAVETTEPISNEVTLSIASTGGGDTIPPPGSSVHATFEVVALQAIPAQGYRFLRWSGDLDSTEGSVSILLDRDMFITAEFIAVADDVPPRFFLPWAAGGSWAIAQGNDGEFSHLGAFAWDFPMPIGTPILAVAAGRVVDLRESTPPNQPGSDDFSEPANFVAVDHGAGSVSYYVHLDFAGVTVTAGQWVARGQVLGFSCDTGFSTAPHLHYEVMDVTGASVSTGFFEVPAGEGIPQEGDTVTSQNALNLDTIDSYRPSTLPADIFLDNGIELFGQSTAAFFYETGTHYVISGRVLDGKRKVCLALVEADSLETVFCDLTDIDEDDNFTIPFSFPAELTGRFFLGVISGDAGAEGITPVSVLISPPVDQGARPTAVSDPPADPSVDFLQTRALTGTSSFPAGGGGNLSYQWMQVSGPPATIADPTASKTEFTLELGTGIDRVSFQLVVADESAGGLHSLPAQIDFLMPDLFFVSRIGMASTLCQSPDTCPVFDPPPPLVTFATGIVLGWVELVNAEVGDVLSFTLIDPLGREVDSIDLTVLSETGVISFWRFAMSSAELDLTPGIWTGLFKRNGLQEETIGFRVIP